MDLLTAFGLLAVTAMLVTYALEDRNRWFILAFAGACLLGSAYGFLQGGLAFRRPGGGLGRCGGLALALKGVSQCEGPLNQSATPMLHCDGLKGLNFIG